MFSRDKGLRELAERAIWTFVQSFLGAITVAGFTGKGLAGAAAAAGYAIVKLGLEFASLRLKKMPPPE